MLILNSSTFYPELVLIVFELVHIVLELVHTDIELVDIDGLMNELNLGV